MKSPSKGDEELVIALDPTKGASDDAEGRDSEDYGEEANDAASALLDAIKSDDPASVVEAFRAMKAVC